MEDKTAKTIEKLKDLINMLVEKYEEAVYARNNYYTELTKIKNELINTKDKIAEQEKKLEQYELKEAFASGSADDAQAKKRIARIIKEIDKCISLLND